MGGGQLPQFGQDVLDSKPGSEAEKGWLASSKERGQ
jgi:hypothetical protein